MVVRIRFSWKARVGRFASRNASVASMSGGLMMLLAVSCLMLSMWRLTSDIGWTDTFVIEAGILSHWQVWLALSVVSGALAIRLMRYARSVEQVELLPAMAAEAERPTPREVASR